jgi:hypothetical protein
MNMKINVLIKDFETKLEAKLVKKETNEGISWTGFVEGYSDEDHKISIVTDDNGKIKSIKKGNKIETSEEEIREYFLINIIEIRSNVFESDVIEIEGDEDEEDSENEEKPEPYDPELIRVENKSLNISYVFEMMNGPQKDLDLSPDFERNFIWTDITRKSRLIESILLRIPLPVFYLSQDAEGVLQVIDGVQRLTVIKKFMSNEFRLKNLEYLKDCEGCFFDKEGAKTLDQKYVRRIKQTQLYLNIIDPQTPHKVKFDIFKRINTAGKPLNNQEIRNCMANSRVRNLLKELSNSKEFLSATGGVSSIRMTDQELVTRFLGFYYLKISKNEENGYKGNMKQFLDDIVEVLNLEKESKLIEIKEAFLKSMKIAHYLFGEYAFRKCEPENIENGMQKKLINKSLFVALSVLLSKYNFDEITQNNEPKSLTLPLALELGKKSGLYEAITIGTNDQKRIEFTFSTIENLLNENLRL